jgi:DNA (cytosine-5)-methyltransferase 1
MDGGVGYSLPRPTILYEGDEVITAVSLFAGVGGFDLAMQRAGIDVVAAVEIDKHAQKVLQRHFPMTAIHSDISEVTGEQLRADGFDPDNGIITGGFPCQDLSIAGTRRGLAGERSGLFWQIIRLTDELQPKWLILENVPGLLSSNRGADMGIVIGALERRGYGICWRVLDAQHFGVAQRRRRLFIVCCLADHRRPVEILFEPESGIRHPAPRRKKKQNVAESSKAGTYRKARRAKSVTDFESWIPDEITNTLNTFDLGDVRATTAVLMRQREGKDGGGKGPLLSDKSLTLASANDQTLFTTTTVRRLTPKECERLQGFPDDWTAGQTDGHRYKQMGNAVAVPVVEWIVRRLVK